MRTALLVIVAACSSTPPPAPPKPPGPAAPKPPPPPVADDPLNLDFEIADGELPKGWHTGIGAGTAMAHYTATLEADAHHGARSLRFASTDAATPGEFGAAFVTVDAAPYRGKHVRLRGWIKTTDVRGYAGLWLRADQGDHGFDNMAGRGVTGTSPWHEVVAETDVAADSQTLYVGPLLVGTGAAWFDALSIEAVTIEPPKPIAIAGRVIDAAGKPVAGAEVGLIQRDLVRHVTSDAAGAFTFDATAGEWAISAHHAPQVGAFVEKLALRADTKDVEIKLGDRDGATIKIRVIAAAPIPAGSFATLAAVSDHAGDAWSIPIAADGTITAVVPRATEYNVRLDGKLLGTAQIPGGKDRIEATVDAAVLGPPPDAVTDWLRDHATALTSPEAGHGFADMAAIGTMIGDAHVVGLGEATHGSREFFQLKHRFLEYLVAEKGFTVFAIEANQPECRAINDYVRDGKGDAKTALAGIYFWTWNTEEVVAMIEWMRAWNADPKHARKLEFTGYDMQTAFVARKTVADYVTAVDPAHAEALLAPTAPIATAEAERDFAKTAPAVRDALRDGLAALAKNLDDHRADYTKRTSTDAFATARHDLAILQQWLKLMQAGDGGGSSVRDESMADNIVWLRAQHPATTRFVVWAHNYHVSRTPGAMGTHLSKKLGKDYINFGFIFGEGAFQAKAGQMPKLVLGEHTLPPAPEEDISTPFTRTGKPILVVDLRALPAHVARWFAGPHPMRETGAVFFDEKAMTQPVQLPKLYDALIFVAKTTRARPVTK